MKVVGISGRIGAGKSILANYLASKGGINLEVDEIGHKLLEYTEIKNELVEIFGSTILSNGKISRKQLGKVAFKNKRSISRLNSVMHPAMIELVKDAIEVELSANKPFILINAALLFSMKLDKLCEVIIYVDSAPNNRLRRLLKFRHMAKEKAENRLFAQDALPESNPKIRIITNNSTIEDFRNAADKLFKDIMNQQ